MDLTTQCPQCGATFQASLEQLQLRKGYIRCVQCAHIFDGYEAVVPAGQASGGRSDAAPGDGHRASGGMSGKPAFQAPGHVTSLPTHVVRPPERTTRPPDRTIPQPEKAIRPPERTISQSEDRAAVTPVVVRSRREFTISDNPVATASDSEPSWDLSGTVVHSPDPRVGARHADDKGPEHIIAGLDAGDVGIEPPEHATSAVHYTGDRRVPADDGMHDDPWRPVVSAAWTLVIVAGVILFAAQLVYVFRVQLAQTIPPLRPALERMCTALNCTVAYSRQLDMIVVTQSSLQPDAAAADTDSNEAVLLQLTLRNAYDGPQEWPTLVLDLKDFSGALIARKHLPRDVYLPVDMVDRPFPANSEHMIVLPLLMQGLKVNGYQLTTFFP